MQQTSKQIPLFYFTPTICWVDDNALFLEATTQYFNTSYNCLTFTKPKEALNYLNNFCSVLNVKLFQEFTETDVFNTYNRLPLEINLSEISKLANKSVLKNEVAVLIIDNDMPDINGLEICNLLKNSTIKKILLTGQTTSDAVIDAFNNGIIDRFIYKDRDVCEKLEKNINELIHFYFYDLSKCLRLSLELTKQLPISDPVFINFFYKLCEENVIEEYYLLNSNCSFLLKNSNGEFFYFILWNDTAIEEFISTNEENNQIVQYFLNQLRLRNLIPFFGTTKESWQYEYNDWKNHFHPANVLRGKENYYWTLITGKK